MKSDENKKFAFFGTPEIAVEVLEILKKENLIPSVVITAPDKARGRGMKITPPPVKLWAEQNKIPFFQPEKLDAEFFYKLKAISYKLFVVVAYGKILPKELLDIPEKGTINLHYSLLPKLRGASPVETAILEDINPSGVTIMYVDEKMDHGPIILQESVYFKDWPISKREMFKKFNEIGGELLIKAMNICFDEKITSKEQDEKEATYTKKTKKDDALIDLSSDPLENYRKILAYDVWPRAFFIFKKNGEDIRVIITSAKFENQELKIEKVIPEGKKEMTYSDFLRNTH